MGETCLFNRGTSVLTIDISPEVLDRMVRSALRRSGRGPVGRFVANTWPPTPQTSEHSITERRESLIRWITDEVRRWSKRPMMRGTGRQ